MFRRGGSLHKVLENALRGISAPKTSHDVVCERMHNRRVAALDAYICIMRSPFPHPVGIICSDTLDHFPRYAFSVQWCFHKTVGTETSIERRREIVKYKLGRLFGLFLHFSAPFLERFAVFSVLAGALNEQLAMFMASQRSARFRDIGNAATFARAYVVFHSLYICALLLRFYHKIPSALDFIETKKYPDQRTFTYS